VKNETKEDLKGEGRNDVILLVDDHTDSRTALAHLFREEGMTVLEAESGEEALGIFEAHNGEIDLLISDMKLPGIDGLELMDRLGQRNNSLNRGWQMKSIALTGYPKEYTESDTAVYSFDEYMEKCGDFDAILRVAQELLNS
jgi:CheY-like chemotaxis protein